KHKKKRNEIQEIKDYLNGKSENINLPLIRDARGGNICFCGLRIYLPVAITGTHKKIKAGIRRYTGKKRGKRVFVITVYTAGLKKEKLGRCFCRNIKGKLMSLSAKRYVNLTLDIKETTEEAYIHFFMKLRTGIIKAPPIEAMETRTYKTGSFYLKGLGFVSLNLPRHKYSLTIIGINETSVIAEFASLERAGHKEWKMFSGQGADKSLACRWGIAAIEEGKDGLIFYPKNNKQQAVTFALTPAYRKSRALRKETSSPLGGNLSGWFSSDFDETMAGMDTVWLWAKMLQGKDGYDLDDYLKRKKFYADNKTEETLSNEFYFFAGRPESDFKMVAEQIELNPKFLDAVRMIQDFLNIKHIEIDIVSAGLKNIIKAFLARDDIGRQLEERGVFVREIHGNELAIENSKVVARFVREKVIIGSEKVNFIKAGSLYAGDNSDENNLAGKREFFINIYWPREIIRGVIGRFKETHAASAVENKETFLAFSRLAEIWRIRMGFGAAVNTGTSNIPASPIEMETGIVLKKIIIISPADSSLLLIDFELRKLSPPFSCFFRAGILKSAEASSNITNKDPPAAQVLELFLLIILK
ncbi:MAG: HAD family hydrolase, partial [Candidatus Omnitrophota bacterium]